MNINNQVERLFRLNDNILKNWYRNNNLDMDGYFEVALHTSDVDESEKVRDFYVDKINKLKIYFLPYLSKNIINPDSAYIDLLAWAKNLSKFLEFELVGNFIIMKWYDNVQPLNKQLLLDKQIQAKLDFFTMDLIKEQTNELKLIPKDYTSLYLVDDKIKLLTLFDFEYDYKPRERIVFCDEELVSYNIHNGVLIQFESKEELKKYLLEKGQKWLKI